MNEANHNQAAPAAAKAEVQQVGSYVTPSGELKPDVQVQAEYIDMLIEQIEDSQAEPLAKPPGIDALMCVIASLRDTAHCSDEDGELTNELRDLRDWAFSQLTAPQATQPQAPAAPAVDALDAKDRECIAIGRAIQRAAGELPVDGEIRIDIENGAGAVYVLEPKHGDWRYIDSGDVLSAQINEAIDAANAAAKGAA